MGSTVQQPLFVCLTVFFNVFEFCKMMSGINEFADEPSADIGEIRCVLKRLYSDFVVIEIPSDGRVLRPGNGENGTAELYQKADDEIVEGEEETNVEKPGRLTDQQFDQMKRVADGGEGQCLIDLKDWPKDERKCLYKFILANFGRPSPLQTVCENGQLTVKRVTATSSAPKRSQWPKGRGDFVHFTMVKRNIDSQSAIHMIARSARLKPSMLALSGTKDRRAITVQRVSAFRVEAHRLEQAARWLRGLWLRDFCYANAPLRLGDAFGNRFAVILRDIDASVDPAKLGARIARWERVGFLNYFGAQRFGTCGVDTAHIGRLLLSEQWEAATAALLAPRAEANESLNECLRRYAGSPANAAEALKLLETSNASAGASVERALLSALAKCPAGHKAAILALHRDMRTMYIHAYQSLVFNSIVSGRKKRFGLAVLAGDLDAAGDVLTDANATIERVCLPLPSVADTKMPQNEIAQCYEEIAAQHSIQSAQFAKLERQFALGSVYRPFLVRPANVQWELLSYTCDTEELQQCEFIPSSDALRAPKRHDVDSGGDDDDHNDKQQHLPTKKALRISFDLPSGTYATVALRELMRTDFDKKAQKELEQEMLTMNSGKGDKDANGGCAGNRVGNEVEMSGDQQHKDGDEEVDGTQQAKRIRINC